MNNTPRSNHYIITGGPGMGKTAIIEQLQLKGYLCVSETGRAIIRHQVESGGDALPWMNRARYAELMFRESLNDFRSAAKGNPVFFDRGIPDVIGYLELCKLHVPAAFVEAANHCRYNNNVFITPPWNEIYGNDAERKQSFEEAVQTYEVMYDVYTRYGYQLVEVPRLPVDERALFLLDRVRRDSSI